MQHVFWVLDLFTILIWHAVCKIVLTSSEAFEMGVPHFWFSRETGVCEGPWGFTCRRCWSWDWNVEAVWPRATSVKPAAPVTQEACKARAACWRKYLIVLACTQIPAISGGALCVRVVICEAVGSWIAARVRAIVSRGLSARFAVSSRLVYRVYVVSHVLPKVWLDKVLFTNEGFILVSLC